MWELVARENPFESVYDNELAIDAAVTRGERPDIPGDTPPQYAQLIAQCWAQEPGERISLAQLIEELSGMMSGAQEERSLLH